MTDRDSQTWSRDELSLSDGLRRLADHGARTCSPRPLTALDPSTRRARGPARRSVPRAFTVGALAAAALSVPVVLSGFVPGLPFAGDAVIATGPPAARAPLCDTASQVSAPAGDRVVRPSATGPLALEPTTQDPELDAGQVRQRLVEAGVQFSPGTQLRYAGVEGRGAWAVTTCGTTDQGSSAAALVTADELGRITARRSTAISAVTVPTFVPVPRTTSGGALLSVTPMTPEAQVVAQGNGTRTVMYRGAGDLLCVVDVDDDGTATAGGTCASTLPQDDGFGIGAAWSDADPAARLTGFAPQGTAWVSVRQDGLPVRDVLVSPADSSHGGHAGFSLTLDRNASVEIVGYSSAGEELGRFAQELDRR